MTIIFDGDRGVSEKGKGDVIGYLTTILDG